MRGLVAGLAVLALLSAGPPPQPRGPGLRHLRFSPDGRYILAQDDSGITVLSVRPFAVHFRAPAQNAGLAEFTPDSRQFVFISGATHADATKLALAPSAARVERWSIAGRAQVESTEIRLPPCAVQSLSPDGRFVGCVDFAGTLRLVAVALGEILLEKRNTLHAIADPVSSRIDFSPDSRYVVAALDFTDGPPALAWDLVEKKALPLPAGLHERFSAGRFVFVAPDRVVIQRMRVVGIWNFRGVLTTTVVAFPSGDTLSTPTLPRGYLFRAADPGFVLVRPAGQFPVGAIEYRTGFAITGWRSALDVLGSRYVAERANGELGLYERGKKGALATVSLDVAVR